MHSNAKFLWNLFRLRNKLIYILDGLRVSRSQLIFILNELFLEDHACVHLWPKPSTDLQQSHQISGSSAAPGGCCADENTSLCIPEDIVLFQQPWTCI